MSPLQGTTAADFTTNIVRHQTLAIPMDTQSALVGNAQVETIVSLHRCRWVSVVAMVSVVFVVVAIIMEVVVVVVVEMVV